MIGRAHGVVRDPLRKEVALPTHSLPDRPNLRHLKDQAKDLLKRGEAPALSAAQLQIARLYGFASWPKLKAHVESLEETGARIQALKQAIDTNDFERVKALMTANPELHRAPLGYGKAGPLSWVAECRVPWEPPGETRLEMAQWMIDHGSDVHQGGDMPLGRATLNGDRVAMMELLLRNGADVNAGWAESYPMVFGPCETVDPVTLRWLLEHGANPNRPEGSALDYLIGTYWRSEQLAECIDILLDAGSRTKFDEPALLAMLRGRMNEFGETLRSQPDLAHRRFGNFDFGDTAARRLRLTDSTLLHAAAEYNVTDAARILLDGGADVNARGGSGQTPIFHAVTQNNDFGFEVARLLIDGGADLTVHAKLPGHYERPNEFVECTPLAYALLFPGEGHLVNSRTIALLRERDALLS